MAPGGEEHRGRAVVVGTSFGGRAHVPGLRAAGFDVVAIVGVDPARTARRAERLGVPNGLTDLTAALDLGVEVVTIASPPDTHAPVALEAISAGCHVLCEKPFTLDSVEAQQIVNAATSAGVVGLLGHEFRWAPERVAAAEAIAGGHIGQPQLASFISRMSLVADPAAPVPDWWFDAARGGGWLGASGSHLVDLIRWWLGEVTEVTGSIGMLSARDADADDTFSASFRMAGGGRVELLQTAGAWGPRHDSAWVAGPSGTVWVDGPQAWLADAADPAGRPLNSAPTAPVTGDQGPALYPALCAALRNLIDGAPTSSRLPDLADGLRSMVVLDAIRSSSASRGPVVIAST